MFCGVKIILELAEYPKDEMLPSVFRTKFLELKDRFYSNFLHVYTDGSKKDMVIAAAMVCPGIENLCKTYRLPDSCTIFTAEAYAIRQVPVPISIFKYTTPKKYCCLLGISLVPGSSQALPNQELLYP